MDPKALDPRIPTPDPLANFYGKRVRVYWNLRKKCFSVLYKRKVVAHALDMKLCNVLTLVSQKGRERVIKEKRKNVHAYLDGILYPFTASDAFSWTHKRMSVTYNPYKDENFKIVYTFDKSEAISILFPSEPLDRVYCHADTSTSNHKPVIYPAVSDLWICSQFAEQNSLSELEAIRFFHRKEMGGALGNVLHQENT